MVVFPFSVQHHLAGLFDIGINGGHDAHFQVVAGQGELEAFGFQQDTLQYRDGGAQGNSFGNAVNGCTQQGLIADDVQLRVSPYFGFKF